MQQKKLTRSIFSGTLAFASFGGDDAGGSWSSSSYCGGGSCEDSLTLYPELSAKDGMHDAPNLRLCLKLRPQNDAEIVGIQFALESCQLRVCTKREHDSVCNSVSWGVVRGILIKWQIKL